MENRDFVVLNTDVSVNILFEICEEEFSHTSVNIKAEFFFFDHKNISRVLFPFLRRKSGYILPAPKTENIISLYMVLRWECCS